MEALAISAANLDTIERNLNSVANELTGVITNVSTVNNQVTKVENQVNHLNNEVQNLVKEIRETTVITNARQAIMYNNDQIEKKYGYYDKVRRTTESLLDAIDNSNISATALKNLNQDLILNNPNYWLSNALAALSLAACAALAACAQAELSLDAELALVFVLVPIYISSSV